MLMLWHANTMRAFLNNPAHRSRQLYRAARARDVTLDDVSDWVREAEARERARRDAIVARQRAARKAERDARLEQARVRLDELPRGGSLRARWLAALASSGNGAAVDGGGTLWRRESASVP